MNTQPEHLRAFVSVTDLARMVGLSRERFYQLQRTGVFPMPVYDIATRRPLYTTELQAQCLEVRRRHCGVNGKPVLFYGRGTRPRPSPVQPRRSVSSGRKISGGYEWLVRGIKGLGLDVTPAQVMAAAKACHPSGVAGIAQGIVIRSVFLHLQCRGQADNAGGEQA